MGTPMTRSTRPIFRSPSRPGAELRRRTVGPPLLVAAFLVTSHGCSRTGDLEEWSPADHDHTGTPSSGQVSASQTSPLAEYGISDVVLAAWRQNCVTCHGITGQGDGPQGRTLRPPDFTHPLWQKNALDDHMRRTIKRGRGSMPGFGHLPDSTVDGLIRLIRLLNRERKNTPADAPAAAPPAAAPTSAAPPGAAPPAGTPKPAPAASTTVSAPQGAAQPPSAPAPATSAPPSAPAGQP